MLAQVGDAGWMPAIRSVRSTTAVAGRPGQARRHWAGCGLFSHPTLDERTLRLECSSNPTFESSDGSDDDVARCQHRQKLGQQAPPARSAGHLDQPWQLTLPRIPRIAPKPGLVDGQSNLTEHLPGIGRQRELLDQRGVQPVDVRSAPQPDELLIGQLERDGTPASTRSTSSTRCTRQPDTKPPLTTMPDRGLRLHIRGCLW
jgi:hypothetical protein